MSDDGIPDAPVEAVEAAPRPQPGGKPYVDLIRLDELRAVMASEHAAIIDFWAPWCAPCRAMAPGFEAVAEGYRDDPAITFYKVNTEEHPELSRPFGVRSLPTILVVKDGDVRDVVVGRSSPDKIRKKAEWILGRDGGLLGRLKKKLGG